MQLENENIMNACAHRLKESNKILTALDDVETNVLAKVHLRKAISENESIISCAEKRAQELEVETKKKAASYADTKVAG